MVTAADLQRRRSRRRHDPHHVWDAALLEPTPSTRSFVFGELVRLNDSIGRRQGGERSGLDRSAQRRPDHGIIGITQSDEIPDPTAAAPVRTSASPARIDKLELELADSPSIPCSEVRRRWREGKLIWGP